MLPERKCSRIVKRVEEEKPSGESKRWWNKVFQQLEEEVATPLEQRPEVLQEVFSKYQLQKFAPLLGLKEEDLKKIEREVTAYDLEGTVSDNSLDDELPVRAEEESLLTSKLSSTTTSDDQSLPGVGRNNPYLKFFKKRPDRAAIWREMVPLSFAEMNLEQRSDTITHQIASDFVEWVNGLGCEDSSNLTVETVISMFEIGFNTHAARSLSIRFREIAAVTDQVAKKRKVPEMAKHVCLQREIMKDIEASKLEPRTIAFGSALPAYLQRLPKKEDIYEKWMGCKHIPVKVRTMETVWGGITHLRSTRDYCRWLIDHPNIKPPEYLVQQKMLDPKTLDKHDEAITEEGISDDDPLFSTVDMTMMTEKIISPEENFPKLKVDVA